MIANLEELEKECPHFIKWMSEFKFGNPVSHWVIERHTGHGIHYGVTFFTSHYQYSLNIIPPKDDPFYPNGYLGCVALTRMPLAGETHNRGDDLNDGPYSRETLHGILGDIVGYEMVEIGK